MSGISSRRIRYAIGAGSSWSGLVLTEGLPVVEHFEPEPVHDETSGVVTPGSKIGVDVNTYQIGPQYYVASSAIHFRASHAKLILDSLFENTAIGASPNFLRLYYPEDVPAIPSSKILSIGKNVAKPSHDYAHTYTGGVITGFTLSQEQGQALRLGFRIAFCHRSKLSGYGANPLWETDRSSGNQSAIRLSDSSLYFGDEGSPTAADFTDWSFSMSWEFEPSFYADQEPDYIARGKPSISGSFTLRDKTSEVEDMNDRMKSGTPSEIAMIASGSFALDAYVVLHGGAGAEEEATRYGRYNFTGVRSSSGASPFLLTITPERA